MHDGNSMRYYCGRMSIRAECAGTADPAQRICDGGPDDQVLIPVRSRRAAPEPGYRIAIRAHGAGVRGQLPVGPSAEAGAGGTVIVAGSTIASRVSQ